MDESLGLKGQIRLTKIRDGKVLETYETPNLIVTAGKNLMAKLLNGTDSEDPFTYIAIGADGSGLAVGNTTLASEITTNGGARKSADVGTTDNISDLETTFTFTGDVKVEECGILNAASLGTLLARQVFSEMNFGDGDELKVEWTITFS